MWVSRRRLSLCRAVLLGELVAGTLLTVMAAPTAKLGDSPKAFSEIVAAGERGEELGGASVSMKSVERKGLRKQVGLWAIMWPHTMCGEH